jgi:hypothetical protein
MSIKWSENGNKRITILKKEILTKKIMLSFIIDNYAWYEKVFKYSQHLVTFSIPIISAVQTISNDSSNIVSGAVLVLSSIAAGMIRIKDYVTYDKLREVAKQQTVKYEQLYTKIEREMIKTDNQYKTEDDLIYYLDSSFRTVEVSDPELTHSMRRKFLDVCKEKNIPIQSDVDILGSILIEKPVETKEEIKTTDILSPSPRRKKVEYTEKIKTYNTRADMDWALSRLNNLG